MIYTTQQLSHLSSHLEKGDCPVKFFYINQTGAETWKKIEEEERRYNDSDMLYNTIQLYLQEIKIEKKVVIFDFGCGVGRTVESTIQYLLGNGYEVFYHAFDISERIIDYCKTRLSNIKALHFQSTVIDFEINNLQEILFDVRSGYGNLPVLGLLLGNTVGNFTSMERTLANIMDGLKINDRLIIGIERAYLNSSRWMDEALLYYNSERLKTIGLSTMRTLGIQIMEENYQAVFNRENSSFEGFYNFHEDTNIEINGIKLNFRKGERIRVIKSLKLNESYFSKLLINMGYRVANLRTSNDNTWLQLMISNTMK